MTVLGLRKCLQATTKQKTDMRCMYPSTRSIRGLIKRAKALPEYSPSGRAIVNGLPPLKFRTKGECWWCKQPCDSRRVWHDDCFIAYGVASGGVYYSNTSIRYTDGNCVVCGDCMDIEVDHFISLAVAREYKKHGQKGWWKAWTLNNLRPLCRACHLKKTADDRRLLAYWRKQALLNNQEIPF